MKKIMFLFKRKAEMTRGQFRDHYENLDEETTPRAMLGHAGGISNAGGK